MNESNLTDRVCRYFAKLKREGKRIEWKKVHGSPMQRRGEPDLDVCYEGRCVKIELKVGKNTTTELQKFRLQQWRKAGAVCGVARSVEEVKELLSRVR